MIVMAAAKHNTGRAVIITLLLPIVTFTYCHLNELSPS